MKKLVISLVVSAFTLPVMATAFSPDTLRESAEERQRRYLIENTKVIVEGGQFNSNVEKDSVLSLISTFYYNQFRHSQDPELPYFMFMSKNANFTMGVGGVVKMRGWYDWNNPMPYNGFSPFSLTLPPDPASRRKLGATPAGTAIYFTVLGRKTPFGNIMGYVEGNFNGYNGVGFKLSRAYVTINDWTVGYAKSTFCDPAATPPTIDGAGPNAEASKTNVLVRYMHSFRKGWVLAGSVEMPSVGIKDDNVNTRKSAAFFPDVAAFGQYEWDGGKSHVRLSGLFRMLGYRDLLTSRNHTVAGWGAQLSGVWNVTFPWTLYAQVVTGRGNGSYINDLSIDDTDLIAKPGNPGELYAPMSAGITLGSRYYIRPNIFSTIVIGEMRYFSRSGAPSDYYKYGLYGAANVFWNISARVQTGIEYLIGKRKNVGGLSGCSDRVTAFFQFNF